MGDAQQSLERIRRAVRITDPRIILPSMHFIHAARDAVNFNRLAPVIVQSGLIPGKTEHDRAWTLSRLLSALVSEGYATSVASGSRWRHVTGTEPLKDLLEDANQELLEAAVDTGRFGACTEEIERYATYGLVQRMATSMYFDAYPHRDMRVFPGAEEVRHTPVFEEYLGSMSLLTAHLITPPF